MTSFGDYQDTLINHQTTQISHHTTNHSKLEDIKTKLDAVVTNTANINVNVGDVEINVNDLEVLQTATNGKLDTINTTLSSGIGGLPASLTGSGNLKVCLQELGNEGSERLNVDVGSTVSQLPSALTGEGNLKVSIQEDFTHNLSTSEKQDTINNSVNSLGLPITALFGQQQTSNIHLNNIYSRQDDILTSTNATKLTNATIATKMTSLESTNHTDLGNIFSRQDDILTSTNAVKTNTQSVENCVSSNKMNVNISSGIGDLATESTLQTIAEFNCDTTDTTVTSCVLPSGASTATLQGAGLPTALSSDNLKVSLKETIDLPITHGALTELASAINSDRLDVNIAAGNISGFATATLQAGGLPSALSSDNLKVSLKETIDLPITNGALTELAAAINSDKVDVNISSGNISGFSTSALQGTANGHLLALANIVNPAIATATATTIPNKLDTIETTVNGIETKTTLHTTSELKQLLSGVTINAGALSSEFDFENYYSGLWE